MVRKRLSNLNSEASKKVVKPEAASPASPPVEPKESVSLPTSVENAVEATSKPEPDAFSVELLEIDVPHVEVKDEESADRPDSAQSSSPPAVATLPDTSPNAALEATIAELNATLETVRQTAQHRETELLEQIAQLQAALQAQQTLADQRQSKLQTQQALVGQLQSELQTQQALIDQLQTELKQSSQLQAELADAKKMILQLSQVNPQPAQLAQPVPSQIRAAEPELEISSPQLIHPAPAKVRGDDRQPAPIALQRQSAPPVRQTPFVMPSEKKPPEQPVIEQNNKLSDADLGWVD